MNNILKSIFVISSFLLISTQTSISQPVDFDFMFGWGVDTGAGAFQICTSADTPCLAGISGSGDGQFDTPLGIAVDAMKNIYVSDQANSRMQVFDSAGNFLFEFGSSGSGDGQFDFPLGIAVDAMKNIYVADTNNNRIQVFSEPPPIITTPIPTLNEWGLIAMAGVLGIVGFIVMRRRKVTA